MNESKIIVAVYGSLKRGFYNHHLLASSNFLSVGTVKGFEMYSLGAYPMVIEGRGSISVETFEVTPDVMASLDRLEGFPSYYGRQIVTVETEHCPIEAWLYMGQPHQVKRQPRVRSGCWQLNEMRSARR